jgi:hypothetical protein
MVLQMSFVFVQTLQIFLPTWHLCRGLWVWQNRVCQVSFAKALGICIFLGFAFCFETLQITSNAKLI